MRLEGSSSITDPFIELFDVRPLEVWRRSRNDACPMEPIEAVAPNEPVIEPVLAMRSSSPPRSHPAPALVARSVRRPVRTLKSKA